METNRSNSAFRLKYGFVRLHRDILQRVHEVNDSKKMISCMGDFQFHCDLLCIWMPSHAETQDMGHDLNHLTRQESDYACGIQTVRKYTWQKRGKQTTLSIRGHVIAINWLVVSTHLKNISQTGNLPQMFFFFSGLRRHWSCPWPSQMGVKIKKTWNHHLVNIC